MNIINLYFLTYLSYSCCNRLESKVIVTVSSPYDDKRQHCWDNPKPLKVSGIFLISAVVSQQQCLLVLLTDIFHTQGKIKPYGSNKLYNCVFSSSVSLIYLFFSSQYTIGQVSRAIQKVCSSSNLIDTASLKPQERLSLYNFFPLKIVLTDATSLSLN